MQNRRGHQKTIIKIINAVRQYANSSKSCKRSHHMQDLGQDPTLHLPLPNPDLCGMRLGSGGWHSRHYPLYSLRTQTSKLAFRSVTTAYLSRQDIFKSL